MNKYELYSIVHLILKMHLLKLVCFKFSITNVMRLDTNMETPVSEKKNEFNHGTTT